MNNQSEKPEHLKPQDSKQKKVKSPEDDNESVVKPEDRTYRKDDAEFVNPAKQRENSEQPVHPVKDKPKD
ncbi:MAG: hypothetical protein ACO1NS_13675 [Daejeonella sp.]|uniref:hypothetical protein n=1 Tax=Daejeonella sp. JGW-45 TaxID=3034148 RepID=UPI0023ED7BC0|nr:hypothetical protein [Daejeonella sp. JGW-45]